MAVRLSIGASRGAADRAAAHRIVLLAVLGGVAGLLVARWTLELSCSLLPAEAPQTHARSRISGTVLLFAAALTLGTGLLFGLFPALHSTRPDLVSTLKDQAGQPSGARAPRASGTPLATAQIALSMALLVSAGLHQEPVNVSRVDLGLKVDNVVTFGISPELNGYTPSAPRQFFERLEEELRRCRASPA